jgi:predicted PurR-regulated permease PerM
VEGNAAQRRLEGEAVTENRHLRFWLIAGLVVLALLFMVRSMLLPFVAGLVVAYFLDPIVDKLESKGVPRTAATAMVTFVFFALLIFAAIMLYPVLQNQVLGFAANAPLYVERIRAVIWPAVEEGLAALNMAGIEIPQGDDVREAAVSYAGEVMAWAGSVLRRFWSGGLALFNVLSLLFITPIVAFYLLRDWDNMVKIVDGLLPRDNAAIIREQLGLVDQAIAGFVRGQAMVAMTLGLIYAIGWSISGLEFGLALGLGTGVMAFIPYVGAAIGFCVALLVALGQFGTDFAPLAMIIGTFAVGQTLDAGFLTPKLVGGRVGLHPVWVVFALLAGATLFGFVGVLIAVPAAAAMGVITRFAAGRYRQSEYFMAEDGETSDGETSGDKLPPS